jgi:hypothetical protein
MVTKRREVVYELDADDGGYWVVRSDVDAGFVRSDSIHSSLIALAKGLQAWDQIRTPEGLIVVLPQERRALRKN